MGGEPYSAHPFISNHLNGSRASPVSSQRSDFSSAAPGLRRPAPSRLSWHTCPSVASTCYTPACAAAGGAGPARLTCTGSSRSAGGRKGSRSDPGTTPASSTSPQPGATAGAGPAPEAAPRGPPVGPGWGGGGAAGDGARPEAGSCQKGMEGRGQAEVTSRDGPAQLSRERKRVEAGGSFRRWESADPEEIHYEHFREE